MENETPVTAALLMDRSTPLGNSDPGDGRRALHTVIKNTTPVPSVIEPKAAESIYQKVTSVPNDVETTVNTYTVPGGKVFSLSLIECEGDNVAVFTLSLNASEIARTRLSYTCYNAQLSFAANPEGVKKLIAGDVLTLKVTQSQRDNPGTFSARIVGVLNDA